MSYSPYYTNGWQDNEAGATPITAAALNNMEDGIEAAVRRDGDTMTGQLIVPDLDINNPSAGPIIEFKQAGTRYMIVGLNASSKRAYIAEHGNNATYYEVYWLPIVTNNLSATTYYNILTDKNLITIAQGGTGADNASGALANLGIRSGRVAIEGIQANSSITQAVAFSSALAASNYVVQLTLYASQAVANVVHMASGNYATTGFDIRLANDGSTSLGAFSVCWTVFPQV